MFPCVHREGEGGDEKGQNKDGKHGPVTKNEIHYRVSTVHSPYFNPNKRPLRTPQFAIKVSLMVVAIEGFNCNP